MYLVDTNILSEARRGNREARSWLRSVDPDTIHLSVVTIGEIMKGISLKGRTDAPTAANLTAWLEGLLHDHRARILPITERIAQEWGRLAAERPRGMADGLIAATALVHGMIIVTRNVADFHDTRAPLINPWSL
jgi:toxin FitB